MEDKRITRRNLIMFPLGTVGRDMVYNLFAYNLATFVFYTRPLSDSQMLAITAIMVAARVFDALNDPVMGNIIERTRTRWGKFKPWQVIGMLTTSVVIYLTFTTKLQGWSFVVFFGVMYFLFSITYTMNDISYWGMIPALSSEADTRNKFTARTTLFAGIGGILASALIPTLTTGEHAIGGSAVTAYGVVALAIAIFAPLCFCFTIFGVKDPRHYEKEPTPPVSFKKIWNTITRNDQLLWISLIFLIQQIGNGIVISDIGKNYVYFDFGYSGGLFGTFQILGMFVTGFLMIFYPAITRRMSRKKLMDLLMIVSASGYAIMLLSGLFMPKGLASLFGFDLKFLAVTLGYMLANFGQYGFYLIMMISIMNTVEYNELKHGTRDEGIVSSLRPFLTKLSSALTIAIANGTIIAFGLTEYTRRIAEQEQLAEQNLVATPAMATEIAEQKAATIDGLLQGVETGQINGMMIVMTVLPLALMFLSYILYKKHYTLDEAEYDEVCRQIEARRASDGELETLS